MSTKRLTVCTYILPLVYPEPLAKCPAFVVPVTQIPSRATPTPSGFDLQSMRYSCDPMDGISLISLIHCTLQPLVLFLRFKIYIVQHLHVGPDLLGGIRG